MKKTLLSLMCVGAAAFSFAQTTPGTCTNVGLDANGVYDDFSSKQPIYHQSTGEGFFDFGNDSLGSVITTMRDSATGMLDVKVSQPYASTPGTGYQPFGFSFGKDTSMTPAKPFTVDLSNDATFSFDITNNSDSTLTVQFAVQDVNGNLINTDSTAKGTTFGNAYKYALGTVMSGGSPLSPGETRTISGSLAKGYYSNYSTSQYDSTFDYTQVQTILVTVVNGHQNAADGYKPFALDTAKVSIDNFKLGSCPTVLSVFKPIISTAQVNVFPNPSSSNVTVSYTAGSNAVVKIANLSGVTMKTVEANGANATFDVSDLTPGMYIVTVEVNGSAVSTEKLFVR